MGRAMEVQLRMYAVGIPLRYLLSSTRANVSRVGSGVYYARAASSSGCSSSFP